MNIGYWSWQDRWQCAPEETEGANKTAVYDEGKRVFRDIQEQDRVESEYTQRFGGGAGCIPQPPDNRTRAMPGVNSKEVRARGKPACPKDFQHHHADRYHYESKEERAAISAEDYSFRLWSRHNPSHCVNPYTTDASRNFIDHTPNADPTDKTFFMKVQNKGYKEAMAIAINNEKKALGNAVDQLK